MQALENLPTDVLRLVLDRLLCLWRPPQVLPSLLKLPDVFLHVWLHGLEVLNMFYAEIPMDGLRKLIKKVLHNPYIAVLHLPARIMETSKVSETLAVLNALDDVLHTMPNLRFLGIHGLQLRQDHVPVFASICKGLRGKLTGFSLSLKDWDFGEFHGERYVFEAIGKLSKLEMLAFPDFKRFMRGSKSLLRLLASEQKRTVIVRGEPAPWLRLAASEVAPNLTIVSAPFDA
jgi:hypothetical protein